MQGTEHAKSPAALLQVSQETPWKRDDAKHDETGHVQELDCVAGHLLCCVTCHYVVWSLLLGEIFQETRTVHQADFFTRGFITLLKAEKYLNTYHCPSHAIQITQPLVTAKQIVRGQVHLQYFYCQMPLVKGQNTVGSWAKFKKKVKKSVESTFPDF